MNADDLARLLSHREADASVALDGETQTWAEPMSDERLAEVRRHVMHTGPTDLGHVIGTALMAPELLAEVERLREQTATSADTASVEALSEVERLRARVVQMGRLLRRLEWQGRSRWDYEYPACPDCRSIEEDGHEPYCELYAELREASDGTD